LAVFFDLPVFFTLPALAFLATGFPDFLAGAAADLAGAAAGLAGAAADLAGDFFAASAASGSGSGSAQAKELSATRATAKKRNCKQKDRIFSVICWVKAYCNS
jgi:hypothetical protein